jgi:nucleoside-diphosphate-sugar epimerase
MKIAITGSSGFVGKNIIPFLFSRHSIEHIKLDKLHNVILSPSFCNINCLIHLAGKAHDLKKVSSPDDYYKVNTDLTKDIFDVFLESNAKVFITFSSVKAVADNFIGELSEDTTPNPITHYGKSKLLSEQYILSKSFPSGKRVYILRPCMIHGPGNKGNLNLLYSIVSKGIPWPLGAFDNKRSFCSIDNLCFIINELIENDKIPSGVYNIADDEPISTNEIINLISIELGKKPHIWNVPKLLIKSLSKLGDILSLPLNSERLNKLTETYIVSNNKIKKAINKSLPVTSKDGLTKTFNSFNNA